jgi:4-hydroxybenzoate polyprenyltransferase/phosphoserine phosphatase
MATVVVASARALCVDLDGTLIATDLLWESVLLLARRAPARLFLLPIWVLRGKAYLKRRIAQEVTLNSAALPFRGDVIAYIAKERRAGREIVLVTASDERLAQPVADHVGLFDKVFASDGQINLTGAAKLEKLREYCGSRGYDYIGNSSDDLPVWLGARNAHLVDPAPSLLRRTAKVAQVQEVFRSEGRAVWPLLRALRLHQWVKNLLLLVPLALSHQVSNAALLFQAACAFLVFGLCASSVYIVNDLLDLEADRLHPNKRRRPFAAGTLSIPTGIGMAAVLLASGVLVSQLLLPAAFTGAVAVYLLIASSYSLFIKRVELLDVFVLAGLYTLRVVSGGLAVDVAISPWLYAFSMFLFTSLAFLKRYAELELLHARNELSANGRGYAVTDLAFLRSVGPTCGLLAILVLSLYINSQEVLELYRSPTLLWLAVAPFAYWITHLWFVAHRGRMTDDPIIFAAKDPVSYVVGACVAVVMMIATF